MVMAAKNFSETVYPVRPPFTQKSHSGALPLQMMVNPILLALEVFFASFQTKLIDAYVIGKSIVVNI